MNTAVKIAMTAVISFGAGAIAGFFFHRKLTDVQFEEIDEAEMAGIEERLIQKENEKKEEHQVTEITDDDLPTDPDKLRLTLQGKVSYLHADQEAKEKYAKIWGAVKDYSNEDNANDLPVEGENTGDLEEGFDENFLELLEEERIEPGQVAPPHPISLIEFYNERNEYDKITIDWYEPDTFVDEREEIIADLKSYFGDIDIKKLFSKCGDDEDPDIRFIRNESYGTDYEIIRHHRSWTETIGGSE